MPTTQILVAVAGMAVASRIHENVDIVLRQGGVAIHPTRVANEGLSGMFQFLCEEAIGATFELTVTIHSPFQRDARGEPTTELLVPFDLARIQQRFTLSRAGQPVAEPRRHPLVEFRPSIGTAASGIVHVDVRTASLDVTALYLRTRRDAATRDLFHDIDAHVEEVDGRPQFRKEAFGGCTPRLLAHPHAGVHWVLVPPALDASATRASVVWLYPERDVPYHDVFDVDLASTFRYLASYGDGDHLREPGGTTLPTLGADGFRGFIRPGRASNRLDPLRPEELGAVDLENSVQSFPFVRLGQQLASSGKKAVLVLYVPHGAMITTERANLAAAWRDIFSFILSVLQTEGLVGQVEGDRVTLDKSVLAGHGSSGPYAIHTFDENRDDFDELWLFDPEHIDRHWARLDHATSARIRLIGGDAHPFLLTKMEGLGDRPPAANVHTLPTSVPNITVWPRTSLFWSSSKGYARAFEAFRWNAELHQFEPLDITPNVVSSTTARQQRDGAWHTAPLPEFTSRASRHIGLVEVLPDGEERGEDLNVAAVMANGSWTHANTVSGMSMNEVVLTLAVKFNSQRPASDRQFLRGVEEVVSESHVRRREWCLFGWQAVSDGTEENEADYKSYFELCLHFSGIEQGTAPAAGPVVRLPSLPEHVRTMPTRTRDTGTGSGGGT